MKDVVTCAEMKELDARTIREMGLPSLVLMERAALAVADAIMARTGENERILVVCGSGNNGGDGFALARLLHTKGIRVETLLAGNPEKMSPDAQRQQEIAGKYGVPSVNNPDWDEYTTIVDAIFGVGLSRPIEGRLAELIRTMNLSKAKKVAVDIPSGVDGDSGEVLGTAFRADLTVTFAFCKRGLCLYPGRMYAGKLITADIGICKSPSLPVHTWHLEKEDVKLLPQRVPWGNKGSFGKVLLVTGSAGMCGAAYLSSAGALGAGAGMVKIQTVEENRIPLQTLLPEAMVDTSFDEDNNRRLLEWCDVLVIGPGLGLSGLSADRAEWFLKNGSMAGKTVILDADGLNLLAIHPEWKKWLGKGTVLTPHVGEMSRLCGSEIHKIKNRLPETAASCAKETGAVCVLKDACTVTAGPEGDMYLNLSGNAGMAAAGSGDVLSGILAGVFCMYLLPERMGEETPDHTKKSALGVYLHGLCGEAAAEEKGLYAMKAGDLAEALPKVLKCPAGER